MLVKGKEKREEEGMKQNKPTQKNRESERKGARGSERRGVKHQKKGRLTGREREHSGVKK